MDRQSWFTASSGLGYGRAVEERAFTSGCWGSPELCHLVAWMAPSEGCCFGVWWGSCQQKLNLLLHKTWLQAECLRGSLPVSMVKTWPYPCDTTGSARLKDPVIGRGGLVRLKVSLTLSPGSICIQCHLHREKCRKKCEMFLPLGFGLMN